MVRQPWDTSRLPAVLCAPAFQPVAAGDVHAVTHRREHARDPLAVLPVHRGRCVRCGARDDARRAGAAFGGRAGHAGRGRAGPSVVDGISPRRRRVDHRALRQPATAAHAGRLVQAALRRAEGGRARAGWPAGCGAVAGFRDGPLRVSLLRGVGRIEERHRGGPRAPGRRRERPAGFPRAVSPGTQVVVRPALRIAPGVRRQGLSVHLAGREQPAAHRPGSGQIAGQGGAAQDRWHGSGGQSLRGQGWRPAGDLVLRPSQPARHGAESVVGRALGKRARPARR
ncbi:hypothetical protein D3C85_1108860 [compost metagenome]